MTNANSYENGSAFTVKQQWGDPLRHEVVPGPQPVPSWEAWFHVAVVQFEDDGTLADASHLEAAKQTILAARRSSEDGAIVVLFIHGWHHNAAWNRSTSTIATDADGDEHFHSFRLLLESLALRERERPHWRRVVGIYVGWNGDPEGALRHLGPLTHGSFWNRYAVSERIGASAAFQETLRTIIKTTKEPLPVASQSAAPTESPLIMIGHSMGALMLESGLLALLSDERGLLVRPEQASNVGAVRLESRQHLVWFPDLILTLNSAANSGIAKRILKALESHQIEKTASSSSGDIRFAPPIMMSVTSTGDSTTRVTWRLGQGIYALWRKTDGNDASLFTHDFVLNRADSVCKKRPDVPDFGQNWHCLRFPSPMIGTTPAIPVDLPTRDRARDSNGIWEEQVPHARYTITPRRSVNNRRLMWVFRVPPTVIKDHNDIFNSKARSLVLALIQTSGAVASLAEDWRDSFEPE